MAVATPKPQHPFASSTKGPARFRFSTDDLPEKDRLAILREVIGKHVTRQDIEPLPDHPLHIQTTALNLPGLFIYWSHSSPTRLRRTSEFLSDGNDNILFQWSNRPRWAQHLGRELVLGPGDATLFSCAETRATGSSPSDFDTVVLSVPRAALGASLRQLDDDLARVIPANAGALNLLLGYLKLLRDQTSIDSGLNELVAAHVCDLLAVTIGATRDAEDVAKKRGVRAARLAAIKQSIREHPSQVTLANIAARHRLSLRYVQMVFEEEGITFTEFVNEERLLRARRELASPRSADRKIAEIAFACGFGDVSYFNRRFRRRFGATPREIRGSPLPS